MKPWIIRRNIGRRLCFGNEAYHLGEIYEIPEEKEGEALERAALIAKAPLIPSIEKGLHDLRRELDMIQYGEGVEANIPDAYEIIDNLLSELRSPIINEGVRCERLA